MQPSLDTQLPDAIAELYRVFRPYRVEFPLEACACCVDESHQRVISAKPLEALTSRDLDWYAFKAITTFGTVNDFKHFLPRLLELIAYERDFPINEEIVFGKLPYASWRDWPMTEQRAIEAYLPALWRQTIETMDEGMSMQVCLACIGRVVESVSEYLAHWSEAMQQSAVARLRFAEFFCTEISLDDLSPTFWEESPEQGKELETWLRDEIPPKLFRRALVEWTQTHAGREYGYKIDLYEAWRKDWAV